MLVACLKEDTKELSFHLAHQDILGHFAIVLIHENIEDVTVPLLHMLKRQQAEGCREP
jgi:hypothetical protein